MDNSARHMMAPFSVLSLILASGLVSLRIRRLPWLLPWALCVLLIVANLRSMPGASPARMPSTWVLGAGAQVKQRADRYHKNGRQFVRLIDLPGSKKLLGYGSAARSYLQWEVFASGRKGRSGLVSAACGNSSHAGVVSLVTAVSHASGPFCSTGNTWTISTALRILQIIMIGKKLLHYEIVEKIGAGGMGEVYRARDDKLGREVAIKILPTELSGDPERVARFDREARTLASLQHPNVASIYGFEEVDGTRFLVMELVAGGDLNSRIRDGGFSLDETLSSARQIATGLEAAHECGIVHRDLKPANIMLNDVGEAKTLDFGLARAWFGDANDETANSISPTITAPHPLDSVQGIKTPR